MVQLALPTSIHFHCASGFDTQILASMLDSLVRVSRRVIYSHYTRILSVDKPKLMQKARCVPQSPRMNPVKSYNTAETATFSLRFSAPKN